MAEELTDAVLERALRELAQRLPDRVAVDGAGNGRPDPGCEEPVPARAGLRIAIREAGSWLRARVRWVVGILLALAFTGLAVSPVGADVARLFGFHGVLVTEVTDAPTGHPDVPPAEGRLSLDQAAALVDFQPYVPTALGAPDRVAVSADRRLLSMSWATALGPSGSTSSTRCCRRGSGRRPWTRCWCSSARGRVCGSRLRTRSSCSVSPARKCGCRRASPPKR